MKKNEMVTIDRDAIVANTYTSSEMLVNAINARTGGTKIEVAKDSDGNEYVQATFELLNPTKDKKAITVKDSDLAQSLQAINNAFALSDVSVFVKAKLIERITDTDAVSLGFDNALNLICSLYPITKTTADNYRRLAKFFVGDDCQVVGAIPKDCSISLLNQLVSWVKVTDNGYSIAPVEILFTTGILTAYMKQSEYKARLKYITDRGFKPILDTLTSEQLAALKDEVIGDSAKRHDTKGKKNETGEQATGEQATGEQDNSNNTVEVSDNPQILAGKALDTIEQLHNLFVKMDIECDFTDLQNIVQHYLDINTEE